MIEEKGKLLTVVPADGLKNMNVQEVESIYRAVTGHNLVEPFVRREYEL